MKQKSSSASPWRPSQRLLFSGLVAIIIVVLAISFALSSVDTYRRQMDLAEEEMLVKARLLATAHEQWLYEMENLLAAIAAGLKNSRQMDDDCQELFHDYLQLSLGIDTMLLVAPNGDLLCASSPISGKINFSDRSYYQRAMRSKKFSVGHFITGRVSRQQVLPMALPILDEQDEVKYLLVAGRTLEWIKNVLTRQYLSAGHDMTVVDGDGTVLAHGPSETLERERPYPSAALRNAISRSDSGVLDVRLQAQEYLVGYTRLGTLASDVFVVVSQPTKRMLQPTKNIILADIVQFLLTLLFVVAALRLGIGRWILRPLKRLATTMVDVRTGKAGYRVEGMGPSRELVAIGESFNKMIEALEDSGKRWRRLADHDPLLGIPNRRYLDEILQREWRRMARDRQPLSILMIDVDMFKNYNDYYGHKSGDECLKRITAVLCSVLHRPADVVARYGGEEFVVLLPETDREGAKRIANEIRDTLAQQLIAHAASPVADRVTVSVGIASAVPSMSESVDILVEHADQALYRAKAAGRNRSEMYP